MEVVELLLVQNGHIIPAWVNLMQHVGLSWFAPAGLTKALITPELERFGATWASHDTRVYFPNMDTLTEFLLTWS